MTNLLSGAAYPMEDSCSLAPLLRNPRASLDRKSLFFHYPHYYETTTPVSAVREGPWKLLEYLEDGHCELYDLRIDRSEKNNLAAVHPQKTDDLREKLHRWRRSVNAQMPSPNPGVAFTHSADRWDARDRELALVD
jgi:hypothetical protein